MAEEQNLSEKGTFTSFYILLYILHRIFIFAHVHFIFSNINKHGPECKSALMGDACLCCWCRTTVWTSSSASSGTTPGSPTPSTQTTLWTWTRLCWTLYGNLIFSLPMRRGPTFTKWPLTTSCSGYLRTGMCCIPYGKSGTLKLQPFWNDNKFYIYRLYYYFMIRTCGVCLWCCAISCFLPLWVLRAATPLPFMGHEISKLN